MKFSNIFTSLACAYTYGTSVSLAQYMVGEIFLVAFANVPLVFGSEAPTLLSSEMPTHTHTLSELPVPSRRSVEGIGNQPLDPPRFQYVREKMQSTIKMGQLDHRVLEDQPAYK
eukprot:Awhi_evm1s10624